MDKQNKYMPDIAIPPAETLIEMVYGDGLSMLEFSEKVQVDFETIINVMANCQPITPELADKLEKAGYAPARFWLNLQHNYEETLKRISK